MQARGADPDVEARLRAMAETIDALQAELSAVRAAARPGTGSGPGAPVGGPRPADPPATPSGAEPAVPSTDARISRRGALALGAAAVAGLGAVADSVLSPTPAWATTGNMQYGAGNNAGAAETSLTASAPSATLSVTNTSTGNGLFVSSAQTSETFAAFNTGPGIAINGYISDAGSTVPSVLGQSLGSGPGISGESTSGYGLAAQGGLAPLLLTPSTAAGPPTAGAHAVGELYVDSAGLLYSCQDAGTPGSWYQVLLGGFDMDVVGSTQISSTTAGSVITGINSAGGGGLTGLAFGAGPGLVGTSLGSGYGAELEGGLAPLYLAPGTSAGAPTAGAHLVG